MAGLGPVNCAGPRHPQPDAYAVYWEGRKSCLRRFCHGRAWGVAGPSLPVAVEPRAGHLLNAQEIEAGPDMPENCARMPVDASEATAPCVDPSRRRKSLRQALRGWNVKIRSRLREQGITITRSDGNRRRGLHTVQSLRRRAGGCECCSAPQTGLEPQPDSGLYWASGGAVLGNYPKFYP